MITPRNPLGRPSSPDDDPTGVRELLSSLPDPGPMPPDLVQRISASLAEEERARGARGERGADGGPGANGEGTAYGSAGVGSVSPLRRHRRRRQVFSGIAGAAAAVVVGFVALTALNNQPGGSSGSMAGGPVSSARGSLSSGAHSGDGSTAGRGGSTAGGSTAGGGQALNHAKGVGPVEGEPSAVSIRRSGHDYRAGTFAAQAAALVTAPPKPGSTSHVGPQDEPGRAGRIGTTAGLADCLAGLGVTPSPARPVIADLARYAGAPAVVLVITSGAGSGSSSEPAGPARTARAWAVGRDCSAADPHVLHGPVTVSLR